MTLPTVPPHHRSSERHSFHSDENIDCRIISIPDLPETPLDAVVSEDQFVCTALEIPLTDSNLVDFTYPSLPSPLPSAHTSPRKGDHAQATHYGSAPLPTRQTAGENFTTRIPSPARRRNSVVLFGIAAALGAIAGIWSIFHDLGWKAWVSVVILLITLCILLSNAFPTVLSMLFGLSLMLVFDIVRPSRAVEGFSNVGVLSVAVLFIVADGIQRTSVLLPIFRVLLGKPQRTWVAQLRVMLPVAIISAFLNNTPVVAMLIPVVQSWSRRANMPVSKLMMPLSNAAVLGGTLTLLGTSTNLVVNGLAVKSKILGVNENGIGIGLPIFGITPIGLVVLLAGLVYMLLFSHWLLRDRGKTGVGAMMCNPREYTVALLVKAHSPIVGETVQEAGLRNLSGLFLVEVTRADGTVIPAVAPDTLILTGDTLLFAGIVETVRELYHIQGLVPATGQSQKMKIERHRRRLVELVIGATSALVGTTAKESQFRSRFSAAIIAVHRQGIHIKQRIADIRLRAGDTLLVEAGTEFAETFGKDSNFALVSEVTHSQPPREDLAHMMISAATAVCMVALAASGTVPLLTAASAAAFVMIVSGCMSVNNAGQAVDMAVVVTIAASFGLSNGLEDSGAAERMANAMVQAFERVGSLGLLFGIYTGTALLSSVITNNAAVSLVFPVVRSIVSKEGVGATSALYTLMIGASACFSTPIGYQTNLMVHGPGGYTFGDWVRFGTPMQLVLGAVGVLTVHWLHGTSSP
ncbi:unnamed protein product [Agarophyton chilense]